VSALTRALIVALSRQNESDGRTGRQGCGGDRRSRGIGRAIVERLAADGATVVFAYARDEAAAARSPSRRFATRVASPARSARISPTRPLLSV